jgi:hypothetical protein
LCAQNACMAWLLLRLHCSGARALVIYCIAVCVGCYKWWRFVWLCAVAACRARCMPWLLLLLRCSPLARTAPSGCGISTSRLASLCLR